MERIYGIKNKWIKALLMLLSLIPIFIRHLWIKGIYGRLALMLILLFFAVKTFNFSFHAPLERVSDDFEITDLSEAYDSGRQRSKTDYIVIHHTAMMSSQKTSILEIASIHMRQHGWSSIAYQYLIMDGRIYKLHNDDDITPHTLNYNSSSIGICIHGNYSKEYLSETDRKMLVWLIQKLQCKYKLDKSRVVKHGYLNATECCGNNININELRKCLKSY